MRNRIMDMMDMHIGNFTSLAALNTLARQKEHGQIKMAHPLWISTRIAPMRRASGDRPYNRSVRGMVSMTAIQQRPLTT